MVGVDYGKEGKAKGDRWRKLRLGRKIGVKEWDYKSEIPVEREVEKGEDKVETSVAIAVQA